MDFQGDFEKTAILTEFMPSSKQNQWFGAVNKAGIANKNSACRQD